MFLVSQCHGKVQWFLLVKLFQKVCIQGDIWVLDRPAVPLHRTADDARRTHLKVFGQLRTMHGKRAAIVSINAGYLLVGTQQRVFILFTHVKEGPTEQAAVDDHAWHGDLYGGFAAAAVTGLTMPVQPWTGSPIVALWENTIDKHNKATHKDKHSIRSILMYFLLKHVWFTELCHGCLVSLSCLD